METRVGHELREFKDQLTVLLVGMLFILLAADVALADVQALGRGGAIVVAGLILVVRPLCVWLSTRDSRLTTKERIFVGGSIKFLVVEHKLITLPRIFCRQH